jgi:hypothetical protein
MKQSRTLIEERVKGGPYNRLILQTESGDAWNEEGQIIATAETKSPMSKDRSKTFFAVDDDHKNNSSNR